MTEMYFPKTTELSRTLFEAPLARAKEIIAKQKWNGFSATTLKISGGTVLASVAALAFFLLNRSESVSQSHSPLPPNNPLPLPFTNQTEIPSITAIQEAVFTLPFSFDALFLAKVTQERKNPLGLTEIQALIHELAKQDVGKEEISFHEPQSVELIDSRLRLTEIELLIQEMAAIKLLPAGIAHSAPEEIVEEVPSLAQEKVQTVEHEKPPIVQSAAKLPCPIDKEIRLIWGLKKERCRNSEFLQKLMADKELTQCVKRYNLRPTTVQGQVLIATPQGKIPLEQLEEMSRGQRVICTPKGFTTLGKPLGQLAEKNEFGAKRGKYYLQVLRRPHLYSDYFPQNQDWVRLIDHEGNVYSFAFAPKPLEFTPLQSFWGLPGEFKSPAPNEYTLMDQPSMWSKTLEISPEGFEGALAYVKNPPPSLCYQSLGWSMKCKSMSGAVKEIVKKAGLKTFLGLGRFTSEPLAFLFKGKKMTNKEDLELFSKIV